MQQAIQSRSAQPLVHINTFGAFLRYLREREQITQSDLVESFDYFFAEYHIAPLTSDMYRKLEKGKRALQFDELLPLYSALVGNDYKLSPQDRGTYVRLARLKLEGLQRKRPKLRPDSEWRLLEIQLAQIDQDTRSSTQEIQVVEQSREKRTRQKYSLDTSHIVGREQWAKQMLSYLDAQKKLVVIQGMMGLGKTSGIKLLVQKLLEREECLPILYSFSTAADITPADHLDTFLATILAELQVSEPEVSKTPLLAKRIEQVLKYLADSDQRIVLLVDDAQVIMDDRGLLPKDWQQFIAEYLREEHKSLIYLATRQWPLWIGRERSYVVDGDDAILPPLDYQAGVSIWQRLGFTDVSDDLLQQASARCGGNALVIELRAATLQRPRFSFSWQRNKYQEQKNEHQQLIEQLLSDTRIFGTADVEARQLLQQVIGQRLSHDALHLLATLAASSLALPFPLLLEINQQAEYAFAELLQASLIDRNAMQIDRAALQPLAREAIMHQLLADKRLVETEQHLITLYTLWLEQGTFVDEQEQAMLVSELVTANLQQKHLFAAAELLIEYGWLSFAYGHAPRLARITEEVMRSFNWHLVPEEEVGGLLLQYHLLARALDKDLGNNERKEAYKYLFDVMISKSIVFKPQTIAHLVHHKLRYLIGAKSKQYADAWALIDDICKQYEDLQITHPITYAELLDRRAYVQGRWGDHLDALAKQTPDAISAKKIQEESLRLRQDAVLGHQQCVTLLQQNERFASPIEQSHMRFKRARLLNDLSYYQRVTGNLIDAKQSMSTCLQLKEAGFVVPSSLAVSYDDYGQLLGQLGYFQEALIYNERALQIMQRLVDEGQSSAPKEKGMLLINRGSLLLLLGKLDEAKIHFTMGIPLVEGTSRDVSAVTATEGLQVIETWQKVNPRCQLDWRWYSRYHEIATYSDVRWLTQAGPFTAEEKMEWDNLIDHQDDDKASKRMSTIIVQSRKRELASSFEEQREPQLQYPLIPHQEVQLRLKDLSQLRLEIEQHEPNVIVRRFYLGAIDERLDELNMIAATAHQDDDAFWAYHKRFNPTPTLSEMEIAVSQLADTLRRGLQQKNTEELSNSIIRQTSYWLINPMDLKPLDLRLEQEKEKEQTIVDETGKLFSIETVARFFADVFRTYQFPWTVKPDITADHARVSLNLHQLTLPEKDQWMSLAKIRELLGHEIETHAFRSNAGEKSRLAILSTGLQGFLETEEGLALLYTQEVDRRGAHCKPNKSWIGTLATGLASGVICEPFTFRQLFLLLESINTLKNLLADKHQTSEELKDDAQKNALNRCLRTWRGVTHLDRAGICSTKDSVYLRGYLSVVKALEDEEIGFDRLMVGSVGLHHLADLKELGIISPMIKHRRLATDPDLEKYILQFSAAIDTKA